MAITVIIENQTGSTLSYLGGLVTVAPSGNTTVPSNYVFPISRDNGLNYDCANGNANLNDGFTDYSFTGAVDYLNKVATSIGGAVVGLSGSPAPSYGIQCAGKDPSGNTQVARVNQFTDLSTNFRNTYSNLTGNSTTTVKSSSGTLHGVLINNNSTKGVLKLYDNTSASGTLIVTIQLGSPSGGLLSTSGIPGPSFLGPLGLEFTVALTVVLSGSTSNDITMVYQ